MDVTIHPGDESQAMLEVDGELGEGEVMFVVETTEGLLKRFSVEDVSAIYLNARGEDPDMP
jgi:hypothetical protein